MQKRLSVTIFAVFALLSVLLMLFPIKEINGNVGRKGNAMLDTPPRKIAAFNNVHKLCSDLGTVGIGEMRKWSNDELTWMSSSDFYDIGSRGSGGMFNSLAFYLESPSENYVESLKVKVNINNVAQKRVALSEYAQTVENTFMVINLPMPSGLKSALLTGRPYENSNSQRIIKNIYESGNIDSWKLQIISK